MTTQILDNAERPIHDKPWEHLSALVQAAESDPIAEFITALSHEERVRAVLNLDTDRRGELMNLLPSDLAADLVEDTPHEAAVDMIERLAPAKAAEIVGELETDVRADLVGEMEAAEAEAILAELDSETAEDIRQLAAYDDDEAGGLMTSDVFQFAASATVGSVLRRLASDDEDLERYSGQHPYIVDPAGRLVGVASLRGLLTAKRSQPLSEIMADVIGVNVHTKLDQLDEFFDAHDFLGAPVVNDDGILVGVVSRSAFADAQIERVEQESLARQGVSEELRSLPLALRSRRRLAWLSANIVLNIIAASVISAYEETLAAVIALAVFLPMVSDMSGCSGNQAVAVTLRELALGLVRPVDAFRVWVKEISVGLINGIVLGTLIALVAWAWKGNPVLGLVIGLALALNTMIAVSIGGVVPLLLKRLGQDPAVASGPLLTTITDMAGFFLVLSLASLFMAQLVG